MKIARCWSLLAGLSLLTVGCADEHSANPATTTTIVIAPTTSGPSTSSISTSSLVASTSSSSVTTITPGSASSPSTAPSTTTPATSPPPSSAPTTTAHSEEIVVSAFFVRDEHVALVDRTVPHTVATGRAAVSELLAGPTEAERELGLSTTIPAGTRLTDVSISSSGTATVDLSAEFESGGGSMSMSMRLAQLVFTLTQFPTVSAVVLAIEGTPVTAFGPEGIVLDHPLTRSDFEHLTPAILVEGPAPFEAVGPQVRVHGTANVFEATFMVRLSDATGRVLYEHNQMATSGTGTRGTFDFVIEVGAATPGVGSLRVWEPSAQDGSDTNVVEIPIELG
jgi:germination protein M